jgi:4-diphosphocytidyl-2-C-methyl-D-erythritol kinase
MVVFPNCKINLGLTILRKREDGYHDLETVFYPLPLKDALEIVRSDRVCLTTTGLSIPGEAAGNLCWKAYDLLKRDFPQLAPVDIHLHKHIPTGAGLGGGSADGAQMLLLLNKSFHLQLDTEKLLYYAAQLGSDCPFFILNTPCLGRGRGERLEPVALDLSGYSFVIVHPGVHISTAEAFASCVPGEGGKSVKEIIGQPIGTWAQELINDFEEPVFRRHPFLRSVKDELYARGAIYAAMSGSGSSLFGIFEKDSVPYLTFDPDYEVIVLT